MKYKLRDICHFPKEKIAVAALDSLTYISTENMLPNRGGVIPASGLPTIESTQAFSEGDVLVSNIRPYFKKIWQASYAGGCSNDVLVFRANQEVDPDFLYYVLSDDQYFNYASATSKGTKMPRGDKVAIMEYPVPNVSYGEQRKISSILKSLDKKIELNKKINHNLQQQARAIYREWFVDFTPNGGIMPTDWKSGRLKDILRLKRNAIKVGDEPLLPYLPIDVIPMNTFALTEFRPNAEAQSSLITFDTDDIVIGAMRVYFHRVVLAPCKGITRTTCFVLAPYDSDYFSFGLLCCDQDSTIDYAQTTSKGSTMPYAVWDGGLGDMEIVIPPRAIAQKFNGIIKPMLRQIQASYFENLNLRNMRDSLLPKLMNGEIDVSEVEV